MRTDGNTRHLIIISAVSGVEANAKEVLETTTIPLAIAIGEKDSLINNDYIKNEAKYNSLVSIDSLDCGHAPHWEKPTEFNSILERFVQKINSK